MSTQTTHKASKHKGILNRTTYKTPPHNTKHTRKIKFNEAVNNAKIKESYNKSSTGSDEQYDCSELKTQVTLGTVNLTDDITQRLADCEAKYGPIDELTKRIEGLPRGQTKTKSPKLYYAHDSRKKVIEKFNTNQLEKKYGKTFDALTDDEILKIQKQYPRYNQLQIKYNTDKKTYESQHIYADREPVLENIILILPTKKFMDLNCNVIEELFLSSDSQYYKDYESNGNKQDNICNQVNKQILDNKAVIPHLDKIINYFKDDNEINNFIETNFIKLGLLALLDNIDKKTDNLSNLKYVFTFFTPFTFDKIINIVYNLFKYINNNREFSNDLIYKLITELDKLTDQPEYLEFAKISNITFKIAKIFIKYLLITKLGGLNDTDKEGKIFLDADSPFQDILNLASPGSESVFGDKYVKFNYIFKVYIMIFWMSHHGWVNLYHPLYNKIYNEYNFNEIYREYLQKINSIQPIKQLETYNGNPYDYNQIIPKSNIIFEELNINNHLNKDIIFFVNAIL